MSAHDFENKVQLQMEELNLAPSDAIWNNVELQLKKDKKRRRVLIWLPLLLLISIGGYLIAVNPSSQKSISSTASEKDSSSKNSSTEKANTTNQPEEKIAKDPATISIDKKQNKELQTTEVAENSDRNETIEKKKDISPEISTDKIVFSKGNVTLSKKETIKKETFRNESVNNKLDNSIDNNRKQTYKASSTIADNSDTKIETVDAAEENYKGSVVKNKQLNYQKRGIPLSFNMDAFNKSEITPITISEVAKVKPTTTNKESKWQWGATVGLGVSRVSEGNFFSGLSGASVADASYSTSVNLPPVPSITSQPAAIHAGPSWQAGLFVQRKLTSRLSLSTGIQYGNYSTRTSIGMAVDSQKTISNSSSQDLRVNNFYTTGSGTDYQNHYQYFEIPVNAHIRLNKSKQLPFYWTLGVTYSSLLKTTALHYDGASGVYYEDDNLFRKSQFSWQTGLSIELLSKSKHPIQLGPQLHYNATSLLSGTASQNTHLWGGSLQLRWFFKK